MYYSVVLEFLSKLQFFCDKQCLLLLKIKKTYYKIFMNEYNRFDFLLPQKSKKKNREPNARFLFN